MARRNRTLGKYKVQGVRKELMMWTNTVLGIVTCAVSEISRLISTAMLGLDLSGQEHLCCFERSETTSVGTPLPIG